MLTLTPAYGRDYKSFKALREDFTGGKDFILNSYKHPYDGKPCNINDLKREGVKMVTVRYGKNRYVNTIKL